jgi:hypothetical protein
MAMAAWRKYVRSSPRILTRLLSGKVFDAV